jgi:hypothetical protein
MTARHPELVLRPEMIACARHLEPFRARWPEGFAALTLMAIGFLQGVPPTPDEAVLKAAIEADELDPATREFWERDMAIAGIPITDEARRSSRMIEVLTARPICERVTREQLAAMYRSSVMARPGECRLCGETKPGAPYSARTGVRGNELTKWPHVCFDCVLDVVQDVVQPAHWPGAHR